jgi:Tfp pilus assembly protein FimV
MHASNEVALEGKPMNRTVLALVALALAGPSLAAEDAPGTDGVADKTRTRFDFAVKAAGGWFDGMGARTDSGGMAPGASTSRCGSTTGRPSAPT